MYQAKQGDFAANAENGDDGALTRIGGEFRSRPLERAFAWERLDETLRHTRLLMIVSAALNALFLLSDLRFLGTPQFAIAVPARLAVSAVSLACFWALRRCASPAGVTRVMGCWMAVVALGVAAMVSSHSTIALFVVIMLPAIFWLVVPIEFGWMLAGGIGCSILMFLGYGDYRMATHTSLGIVLALVILNCALAMSVTRNNRLSRLQWLAVRSERRIAGQLAQSREMMEQLFAASPVPMLVTAAPGGEVLSVNDSAVELFGFAREKIVGHTVTRHYADPAEHDRIRAMLDGGARIAEFETEVRTADGSPRFVMVKSARVETPAGRININGVIDISDRKATERSLEWLASTDGLTGLPNRMRFFSSARAEMMRSVRHNTPLALLMVDLDHFKLINDSFGHQAGDQSLRAFAAMCLSTLRDQDIVGRLGGEEFGVLLPGAGIEEARAVAETLRRATEALRLPGDRAALRLSISIGIAPVRPHERDLDQALARADMALYAAKRAGRNRIACDGEALVEVFPEGAPERRRGGRARQV